MGHNAKPNEHVMAKGYWIVSVDISNPESHKMYVAETRSAFRKYGHGLSFVAASQMWLKAKDDLGSW